MIEFEVTIVNRLGLHARAAAKFVHLASAFALARDGRRGTATRVDGKSILGLLTLAAARRGPGCTSRSDGRRRGRGGATSSASSSAARFGEDA